MIIKYRGQLYKRVDTGGQKIAEVLKRKLQTEASKVGAKIDITGSVNEKTGGELSIWLKFSGSEGPANRAFSKMVNAMEQAAYQLNSLPFFNRQYHVKAKVFKTFKIIEGESRQVGKIIIEPQEEDLDRHKQQGLPRYSEQAKDENAVKAASYILRSLELPSGLPAYASQLGRLDASLAKEVKALYAKASEIASRCKELYQKHR